MMNKYITKRIQEVKASKQSPPTPIIIKARKNDENSQDLKLMKGMPIIARKTTDKLDIMNNETLNILKINEDAFVINVNGADVSINTKEFSDLFYVAFAMTIHKSQGQTFNHDYTIYEWEKLDKRLKYVALSRATDLSCIHLA
jgi:ATP-dependent exoDNAse (exonuclease V) alpha subunit